jgi:Uncharacterized protein conserved in bacteria
MSDVKFEIKKMVGVVSSNEKSKWQKELNLISWSGKDPKYDLRDWDPEHEKMGKGVTLTEEELRSLYDILAKMFKEDELILDKA